jgi:general secretion pathway protein A
MYEAFFGLRERPFSILPDPDFLYLSRGHSMALVLLEYGLTNQAGFSVITGAAGTGKTTLIRHFLRKVSPQVSVGMLNSSTYRTCEELLQWMLHAFQIDYRGLSKVEMVHQFLDFLQKQTNAGKRAVLIIDEAQSLNAELLEELRVLSNVNIDKKQILQIVLVGQPDLRATLSRPELANLMQRVAADYQLNALGETETAEYIRHRIYRAGKSQGELFDADASAAVHRYTGGLPRLINLLCDSALVYAFGEGKRVVDAQIVHDAARDKQTRFAPDVEAPVVVSVAR